jgi:hypothetical protein
MDSKIKKSYSHDRMRIQINFFTGASLSFNVSRSGETLNVAFSNDRVELKKQSTQIEQWLKLRKGETNQDRFDRLENVAKKAKSGKEFMELIK